MLFAYLLHWILDKVTQKQLEESDEDMMRTLYTFFSKHENAAGCHRQLLQGVEQ